ncbi:MAG: TetR family transcriptional regulator, partial [Deltaproteobacteria bacterium]|nr:TetR family transcriptional regulator [Nannocystaceae bacterium]
MAAGRSYHHGDLRNALIEAALVELGERDIETISLREVARTAGVSSGAPYRHFATRTELLAAVAIEGFSRLGAAIDRAVGGEFTPRERMLRRLAAYLRFALEHGHHYRVMFHPTLREATSHDELDAVARVAFDGLVAAVVAVRPAVP